MQPFISLFFFALLVNLADLRKSVAPATQIYSLRLAHRPAICANHPPPYDFSLPVHRATVRFLLLSLQKGRTSFSRASNRTWSGTYPVLRTRPAFRIDCHAGT
jgi:hypothetical protein